MSRTKNDDNRVKHFLFTMVRDEAEEIWEEYTISDFASDWTVANWMNANHTLYMLCQPPVDVLSDAEQAERLRDFIGRFNYGHDKAATEYITALANKKALETKQEVLRQHNVKTLETTEDRSVGWTLDNTEAQFQIYQDAANWLRRMFPAIERIIAHIPDPLIKCDQE